MCRLGTNSGREAPFIEGDPLRIDLEQIQIEILIIANSLVTNCMYTHIVLYIRT